MKRFVLYLVLAAATVLMNTNLHAGLIGLTFSGGGTSNNTNDNRGWSFTANQNIMVDELGFFDNGSDGLVSSHNVGIWSISGSLITSATVPSGTAGILQSGFRFVDISDVQLYAGQTYVIGGKLVANADPTVWQASSFSTIPEITYGTCMFSNSTDPLVFPWNDGYSFLNPGFFGPNFTVAVADPIPEPSTYLLFTVGILSIIGIVYRQRKKAASE